jgi:hypothetical protein
MENHPMRALVDAGAVALVAGSMAKVLPPVAAAVAIWWYGIQIWQSETGRNWRARWKRLFFRQALSVEDKILFLFLGLAGGGVFMGLMAVEVLIR